MITRIIIFCYGIACYGAFLAAFVYLAGFLANFAVPRSVDVGTSMGGAGALLVNVGLLLLFGIQHSVMARPAFKRQWTRLIPEPMERSTYVLISSIVLAALFVFWQPLPDAIWEAESLPGKLLGWGAYGAGLGLVLASTLLIDHLELFGLKQVICQLLRRRAVPPQFQVRYLYKFVRHPLYLGWLITVWATPTLSVGHALFAGAMTAYILIAVRFEESDLVDVHGQQYERYRAEAPMLVPRLRGARARRHEPQFPGRDSGNRNGRGAGGHGTAQ